MKKIKYILIRILKILLKPALFLNRKIKETNWYLMKYGDILKFKRRIFNLDIVNLGNDLAKYAFDYSDIKVKSSNWAADLQSITYDFKILKNYHSFIKENGVVLLPVFPFTSLIADKTVNDIKKYHYFLHPVLIPSFSENLYIKIIKEINYPLIYHPVESIKSIIKDSKNIFEIDKNSMNEYMLKRDAQEQVEYWKKETKVVDLAQKLSVDNKEVINNNVNLLLEMIDFCKERLIVPVVIIMPVSKYLSDMLPDSFIDLVLYDQFIKRINMKSQTSVLDYYKSDKFTSADLYFDSLHLNKKGRIRFTEKVINDIECFGYKIKRVNS
jgi:hypothetical protein